jgi:GGDEF domain-containing protein
MLEFESDGERDSLTGVLAPARFLTVLESEVAIAVREGRALTLLTLSLSNKANSTKANSMNPPTMESAERLLKNMAITLHAKMRAGDHCGRIAEDGFWILARGDKTAVGIAAYRFLAEHESYDWLIEYYEISKGEKVRELLRRIDALYFEP